MDLLMRRRALMMNLQKDEIICTRGESSISDALLNYMYTNGYSKSRDVLTKKEAINFPETYLNVTGNNGYGDLLATQWFNIENFKLGSAGSNVGICFVILPPTIKSLSDWAFYYTSNPCNIIYTSSVPPTNISNYFSGYNSSYHNHYVPDEAYAAYVTAFGNKYHPSAGGTINRISDLSPEDRAKIKVIKVD